MGIEIGGVGEGDEGGVEVFIGVVVCFECVGDGFVVFEFFVLGLGKVGDGVGVVEEFCVVKIVEFVKFFFGCVGWCDDVVEGGGDEFGCFGFFEYLCVEFFFFVVLVELGCDVCIEVVVND